MEKKLVELHFPLAGVDRSLSYQKQHPYTTPRAVNVWPDGQLEGRERGGSRPGIDTYIHENLSLFGPVRLLTKIGVQEDLQITALQTVPLKIILTAIDWEAPPWSTGLFVPIDDGIRPGSAGLASLFSPTLTVAGGSTITLQLEIAPVESCAGQYWIFIGHDGSFANGNAFRLQLSDTGAWSGDWTDADSVVTPFTTGTDNSPSGGTFRVRLTSGGTSATVYWKWHQIGSFTIDPPTARWGFAMQKVGDTGGSITNFNVQYQSAKKEHVSRRDMLVAIAFGDLWYEVAPRTMAKLPNVRFSDDKQLQACDYLQKLYIADHGQLITGDTGVLASPGFVDFTDGSIDFEALGVNDSYVLQIITSAFSINEQQFIQIFSTDGGTFQLTFDGAITQPIAHDASAATVEAALEELPNIGTVSVTKPNPYEYVVEFDGVNEGRDMELLGINTSGLSNSGAPPEPSALITTLVGGKSGESIASVYEILEVDGTTITLVSGPNMGGFGSDVTGIKYSVHRPTRVFDPKTLIVEPLRATKGVAPSGASLIALYRDRIFLGNLPDAPHQWFACRQGDPLDWDYSQTDAGAAVSGPTGRAGTLGEPLTALIPHSSRCMIMACYSTLWILRGDPAAGGDLDNVSYDVGVVSKNAWCHTPTGELLILTQDGLYVLPAGCAGVPYSLSRERMPRELLGLDPSQHSISLVWDTAHRGIHIFLAREDLLRWPHWFYDWETKGFWEMDFDLDHQPFCAFSHTPIGEVQQVLLGCLDGFVRHFSDNYWTDSGGKQINSELLMGPIRLGNDYREGVLTELQFDLGRNSGAVNWSIQSGETAEHAYYAGVRETGELEELNNWNARPRVRGHSVIVKLLGAEKRPWVYEHGHMVIRSAGRRKRRR